MQHYSDSSPLAMLTLLENSTSDKIAMDTDLTTRY